jgi:NHL repeat
MGARRLISGALLSLCATLCGFALASASAQAVSKSVVSSFGSQGSEGSKLSNPLGVAVNQASDDVYVVDSGNNRVQQFTAAGVFVRAFGVNVGGPGVDVCASGCVPGTASGAASGMSEPQGIAIEQLTGDLYVTDQGNHRVDEFTEDGAFVRAFGWGVENGEAKLQTCTTITSCQVGLAGAGAGEFGASIGYPAIAPVSGEVYVADPANTRVERFEADGAFVSAFGSAGSGAGQFGAGSPLQIGVGAAGNLYVTDPGNLRVQELGSTGTPIAVFASQYLSGFSPPEAVVAEPTLGDVLVAATPSPASGLGPEKQVLEFDSTGDLLADDGAGAGLPPASGLAIGPTAEDIYYTAPTCGCVLVLGSGTPPPQVAIQAVSGIGLRQATLHGTVDPEEAASNTLTMTYRLQYSTDEVNWTTAGEGTLPAGEAAVPVSATTGELLPKVELQPNTIYHVRLVVERAYNAGSATSGVESFTTLSAKPVIVETSFSEAGTTGVTVTASVSEEGLPTTYMFEYGPTEAYGSTTPMATLPSGSGSVTASARLSALAPDGEYHFRIVASNADGVSVGADEVFRTLPLGTTELPDGRVYEKVSSTESQERDVFFPFVSNAVDHSGFDGLNTKRPFRVSAAGDAVSYQGEPTSPGGIGSGGVGEGVQYVATRSPAGTWSQVDIQPPGYLGAIYQSFSSELTTGYLSARSEGSEGGRDFLPPLVSGVPVGVSMLYARPLTEDAYSPFFTNTPPNRIEELKAAGIPSFSFRFPELAYAGSSADGSKVLFEANDALVNGAEAGNGTVNNLYESVEGKLKLVNELPGGGSKANATFGGPSRGESAFPDFSNVISEDGTRVFWTDMNTHDIYVRENGTSTVSVSAGPAQYWTATPDGRFAYYTESGGLWRFDTQTASREELVADAAEAQGVVGISENGEYVYFVADQALGSQGTTGAPNLYLLHSSTMRFIATLSGSDLEGVRPYAESVRAGDLGRGVGAHTAEVTPDGQALVFTSSASLTGYDNVTRLFDNEPRSVQEVYVYNAADNKLICASCDRSGERAPYSVELEGGEAAGYLPISWSGTYQAQWISNDGSRVFFDADVPLVPRDTNERQDVYEWERDGAGGCRESLGCIYLISDGISKSAAWLIGTDTSGRDAFFVSRAKLTPSDGTEVDVLYDAREGGVRSPVPPQCSGTGCQGVPGAPPVFATPASVTFEGVGNFSPATTVAAKPPASKSLTRSEKLRAALRVCARERAKQRRLCEAHERKRYGTQRVARKASHSTRGRK